MTRWFRYLLILLVLGSSVFAQEIEGIRSQLPSKVDRIRNQRLDNISKVEPRATTEQLAVIVTQGPKDLEATILINPYRLLERDADTYFGYRSIPWWLRNVQLSFTFPAKNTNGQDLSFELKWGLYKKAHRWDEYWDPYFHIGWPQRAEDITDEWLEEQQARLLEASEKVNTLLLVEGNDGFSLSLAGKKMEGEWEQFSFTLIGSHRLSDWLATLNGAAEYLSDDFGTELAGQISREIWADRWENGGLTFSLAGSATYIEQWDWSTTASLNLPILDQARFLLAFSVTNEESRILTGLSYQFLPTP